MPSVTTSEAQTATTSITQIEPFDENSPEEITRIIGAIMCEEKNASDEFGFEGCSIGVTLDTPLNIEELPIYADMEETAEVADKNCIICPKTNMDLQMLTRHYVRKHHLVISEDECDRSPLDKRIQAKESMNESNLEFMMADIEDEDNYKSHSSSSDSSSESSSEGESEPQKKKS